MKMGWHGSAWMGLAGLLLMLTPFAAASQCQSILSVAQKLGIDLTNAFDELYVDSTFQLGQVRL